MRYVIILFVSFFFVSCSFLISCGGSSNSSNDTAEVMKEPADETAAPETAAPETAVPETAAAEIVEANPIVETQFFGQSGNIYKPESDPEASGDGNLVVLLSSQFTEQFDRCEIALNTGETKQLVCINNQPWTQIPFSCFSNGNRQTWRADFKCSSAAEVKVTCFEDNQEIIFTVPEAQRGQICSRFG